MTNYQEMPIAARTSLDLGMLSDAAILSGLQQFQNLADSRGLVPGHDARRTYPEIADKQVDRAYLGYIGILESLGSIGVVNGTLDRLDSEAFVLEHKNWLTADMTAYMTKMRRHRKNTGLNYMLIATPNVTVSARGVLELLEDIGTNHADGIRIDSDEKHGVLMTKYNEQEVSGTSPWDKHPVMFEYVPSRYVGRFGNLRRQRRAMARLERKPVVPTSPLNIATYLKTLALQQPSGKIATAQARALSRFFLTDMSMIEMGTNTYIPFVNVIKEGQLTVGHVNVTASSIFQRPAVGAHAAKQRRVYLEPWRVLFSKKTGSAILANFTGPAGQGPQ